MHFEDVFILVFALDEKLTEFEKFGLGRSFWSFEFENRPLTFI